MHVYTVMGISFQSYIKENNKSIRLHLNISIFFVIFTLFFDRLDRFITDSALLLSEELH